MPSIAQSSVVLAMTSIGNLTTLAGQILEILGTF